MVDWEKFKKQPAPQDTMLNKPPITEPTAKDTASDTSRASLGRFKIEKSDSGSAKAARLAKAGSGSSQLLKTVLVLSSESALASLSDANAKMHEGDYKTAQMRIAQTLEALAGAESVQTLNLMVPPGMMEALEPYESISSIRYPSKWLSKKLEEHEVAGMIELNTVEDYRIYGDCLDTLAVAKLEESKGEGRAAEQELATTLNAFRYSIGNIFKKGGSLTPAEIEDAILGLENAKRFFEQQPNGFETEATVVPSMDGDAWVYNGTKNLAKKEDYVNYCTVLLKHVFTVEDRPSISYPERDIGKYVKLQKPSGAIDSVQVGKDGIAYYVLDEPGITFAIGLTGDRRHLHIVKPSERAAAAKEATPEAEGKAEVSPPPSPADTSGVAAEGETSAPADSGKVKQPKTSILETPGIKEATQTILFTVPKLSSTDPKKDAGDAAKNTNAFLETHGMPNAPPRVIALVDATYLLLSPQEADSLLSEIFKSSPDSLAKEIITGVPAVFESNPGYKAFLERKLSQADSSFVK